MDEEKEIKVVYWNLQEAIGRMQHLEKTAGSRKIEISMPHSQGKFSEELIRLADSLNECGQIFSQIAGQTGALLQIASESFRTADDTAAKQYQK